ncbi:MAG TPA: hypothetical protein VEC39_05310, partial [Vicinamibacterales bacterium]|nr:hypothetical protein [Vicinamibacterales bacterium]
MAVTVRKSASKPVKAAIYLALNVTALTTTVGAAATPKYTVAVHGKVSQPLAYPHVRVDAAGGRPDNETFGRNAQAVRMYVQIFALSEEQALEIESTVLGLLNRAGGYNTLGTSADAIITAAGWRLIHVNWDDVQTR